MLLLLLFLLLLLQSLVKVNMLFVVISENTFVPVWDVDLVLFLIVSDM